MSIVLRKRKNSDGTISLRLDIYDNGKRWYEPLHNLKLSSSSSVLDRETNKQLIKQAEAIRLARLIDLEANGYNINTEAIQKTQVLVWLDSYVNQYNKKDKRNMQGAVNRFRTYLKSVELCNLTFNRLTPIVIEDFIDYLQATSTGEGPKSYYYRFKKMIKMAYRKKFLKENVLEFVEKKVKGMAKKKDVLSLEEIQKLYHTPISNTAVRNAFLFSCCTGLAWIDVKHLTWKHIRFSERKLEIVRAKLSDENVTVTIHINETAFALIGSPSKKEDLVFKLPSANGANKLVKKWVASAKIDKTITWHNARHSYGTNLISKEVDIYTTSKLLGHKSIKHTHRYIEAASELMRTATEKISITL